MCIAGSLKVKGPVLLKLPFYRKKLSINVSGCEWPGWNWV